MEEIYSHILIDKWMRQDEGCIVKVVSQDNYNERGEILCTHNDVPMYVRIFCRTLLLIYQSVHATRYK